MGFFSNLLNKTKADKTGGMEDFMTLLRVYMQGAVAAQTGLVSPASVPELMAFKRANRVPTLNNKLGLGEKRACQKQIESIYGVSESFFRDLDQSIKRGCKRPQDVQTYMYRFQGYSQEVFMLVGNLMKWKFRIPSFMRGTMRKMIAKTVHDIYTKSDWTDAAAMKSAYQARKSAAELSLGEAWTAEYLYHFVMLAKKEPRPSDEAIKEAEQKMKKK